MSDPPPTRPLVRHPVPRHPVFAGCAFEPMTVAAAREFEPTVRAALDEDAAFRDATTKAVVDASAPAAAHVNFRTGGVPAGLAIAALAMQLVDDRIAAELHVTDGAVLEPDATAATFSGPARGILSAERVAINFLSYLSGIATVTREFVDAVRGTQTIIADTRKTTPGLRALERYAVRAGGGCNHRFDLSTAILIKDNHLAGGLGVKEAVARARERGPARAIVEVECDTPAQVREAVEAGADSVLLDNMSLDAIRQSVAIARGKAVIEVSGGVTLATVRGIALTGVEVISVGALTHGAAWLDIGLDF